MSATLNDSYRFCQTSARRTGRNFYFSFLTLPRRLFRDMCVLYAFMRHTDDLGDCVDLTIPERRHRLQEWRARFNAALAGDCPQDRVLPALMDVIRRHSIPSEYLSEVISGVESDLGQRAFETFDDLSRYCYQVAGAVGLCCIHIWGFHDPRALRRAVDCGLAFQLTNILRDLGDDARMGRVYLPREELAQFGYAPKDLAAGVQDERFRRLMQFQIARAKSYYARGTELHEYLSPPGRRILSTMLRIYASLLREIERREYDVFSQRVRVSSSRKLAIAWTSLLGRRYAQSGMTVPAATRD